jgi:hypothetical protein
MTAEAQSDKKASNMEVRMKQRCIIEFLNPEKIAPNDIHRRLPNAYGGQTVDVSKVDGEFQQWRQQRERQATFRTAMNSCHTTKRKASRSAHPHESADYD